MRRGHLLTAAAGRASLLLAALAVAPGLLAAAPPLFAPTTDGAELSLPDLDPTVPSPATHLGYPLGERFTPHADMVAYLEALAAASPRVSLERYGTSYEGRPLLLLAVSDPARTERLAEVRDDLAALADPAAVDAAERRRLLERSPVVVWLAYGVHGNESSSSEAALAVAYTLAAAGGALAGLLEDMVVVIDPLLNPDGRERYVQGHRSREGSVPNPSPPAAELHEPWPGGRGNHYLLDLNRDWPWLTQTETRARVAAYRRWHPHVFVDLHEMQPTSTYFFPPPAEPVSPHIDRRLVRWLDVFGRANAREFDRQGWLYYAEETFDLFYPGYGDTYPGLRGAVGMTYEMAGGGGAGRLVERPDGSLLSLADRVVRHYTASLATVETAARNRDELLADFVAANLERSQAPGRTYLWADDGAAGSELATLLMDHGVEVVELGAPHRLTARPLTGGDSQRRSFPAGTLGASTAQPLGRLVAALLDLEQGLEQEFLARQRARVERNLPARFYDLTSWSLPVAFGVEVWISEGGAPEGRPYRPGAGAAPEPAPVGRLGLLVPPQAMASYRLAARLQREGLRHRVAVEDIVQDGNRFPPGTLFIPRAGNPTDLEAILRPLLAATGARGVPVSTLVGEGSAWLGSDYVLPVRESRIALAGGEGTVPTSFGALWHLLDRQLEARLTWIELARVGDAPLADFDVLVLPDGDGYSRLLGEEGAARIAAWVRDGGTLVAVGTAHDLLGEHGVSSIEAWTPDADADEAPDAEEQGGPSPALAPLYHVPGASLRTEMTPGHRLTLGLDGPPAVLFLGRRYLLPTGDPQRDVLRASEEQPVLAGVAWPEARERLVGSLLVGAEPVGRGKIVVFSQHPAYRLFWLAPTPIFLNAVLFGPSL